MIKEIFCSTWNIIKNNYYVLFSKKVIDIEYQTDTQLNFGYFTQMYKNDFNRKLKELRKDSKVISITVNFKIKIK